MLVNTHRVGRHDEMSIKEGLSQHSTKSQGTEQSFDEILGLDDALIKS